MGKPLFRLLLGMLVAGISGVGVAATLVEQFASPVSDLDGHRYVIYSAGDFDHPISWSDARDAAGAAGGYLATVTSAGEESFLQDAFAGSRIFVGVAPWIGLSDAAQEGTFRWVTGPDAGQALGYSDWLTGEPNNNGPTGNEDYVTWSNYPWGPAGGAWNDVNEGERIWQLLVEFDPVLEFLSGTNPENGHTYAIYRAGSFENPISWFGARNAASMLGGYLATITSASEEAFLQDAFAGARLLQGVTAWIGLSDEAEEGAFRWVTGPGAPQPLGFSNWLSGEPNNDGQSGNEDYVTWANYPFGPAAGAWNDAAAGERVFRFIVELQPQGVPEPSLPALIVLGLLALAWTSAARQARCRVPEGRLIGAGSLAAGAATANRRNTAAPPTGGEDAWCTTCLHAVRSSE